MKKIALIIGITTLGVSLIFGFKTNDLPSCPNNSIEIGIEMTTDLEGSHPVKRICKTQEEYIEIKHKIRDDFKRIKKDEKGKNVNYDFDINLKPLVQAVINIESEKRGKISMQGADKDKIKKELLKWFE